MHTKYLKYPTFMQLLLVVLTITVTPQVAAQIPVNVSQTPEKIEVPEQLTQAEIRDMVARLSDDQVRQLIIDQLDKQAVMEGKAEDAIAYFDQLTGGVHMTLNAIHQLLSGDEDLHAIPGMIWMAISENGEISGGFLLFQLIALVVAGLVLEYLTRYFLRGAAARKLESRSLLKRFDLACYFGAIGLIELGAFALGAFLLVELTGSNTPGAKMLWHQLIICLVMIKLVMLGVRLVAAPGQDDKRLLSVDGSVARNIWGWTLLLSASIFLPLPLIESAIVFGASADSVLLLRVLFGSLFLVFIVALIIKLRRYGSQLIAGDPTQTGVIRQNLSQTWWLLAIAYVSVIWLMAMGQRAATGESSLVPGMGSLLLFVAIPYLDQALKNLIAYYFSARDKDSETAGEDLETDNSEVATQSADDVEDSASGSILEKSYHITALRYARVLMVLTLLAVFLRLWNIDIEAISAQLVGTRFASALFDISITILLAWALWGVIRISIERKLESERGPEDEDGDAEVGGLGGTRTATILPLIRAFIKISLIVMTIMVCLSALGVNIGPLIAGAGVVGIAIGFGAQTLVRDIVSGFFFLIDDAFRIGEYVEIDQIRGSVERISIRSFQLRHHNGPVHTIPYGEIRSLTNWSRDWAIMKFELRIPFETDIEKVRKLIKRIGISMMEDPLYGPMLLEPLKSQGVNRMDDSALIIRCKFTAIPGKQFLIRREAFTRIQRVFEENSIHFAPRRVLVEASTPQAAIEAAAGVIDQEGENQGNARENS